MKYLKTSLTIVAYLCMFAVFFISTAAIGESYGTMWGLIWFFGPGWMICCIPAAIIMTLLGD